MGIYYTIFTLLLLCCFFEFSKNTKLKRNIIIAWCVFFTLFGGLRWNTGGDFEQYYYHFRQASWNNIFEYYRYGDRKMEFGFMFVNVLIKTLFSKFYIYNLIVTVFIQFTYYKFSRYFFPQTPIIIFAILMIMSSNYFAVRAGLSVAIVYWAYRYIKEQKLWPFLTIILIASSIHNQCLIMIPFYWIGKIRLNNIVAIVLLLSFTTLAYAVQNYVSLLSLSIGGSIGDVAYHYSQRNVGDHTAKGISTLLMNLFFLINYLYVRKSAMLQKDRFYNTLLNMFLVYVGMYMIFTEDMGEFTRLAGLLFPAQGLLFAYSIIYYAKSKAKIVRYAAIFFFVLYYSYKISGYCDGYYFGEANVPYKSIFDYNIN